MHGELTSERWRVVASPCRFLPLLRPRLVVSRPAFFALVGHNPPPSPPATRLHVCALSRSVLLFCGALLRSRPSRFRSLCSRSWPSLVLVWVLVPRPSFSFGPLGPAVARRLRAGVIALTVTQGRIKSSARLGSSCNELVAYTDQEKRRGGKMVVKRMYSMQVQRKEGGRTRNPQPADTAGGLLYPAVLLCRVQSLPR